MSNPIEMLKQLIATLEQASAQEMMVTAENPRFDSTKDLVINNAFDTFGACLRTPMTSFENLAEII